MIVMEVFKTIILIILCLFLFVLGLITHKIGTIQKWQLDDENNSK